MDEGEEAAFAAARARMERIAGEAIREAFHRMPWGQEFTLSTGAVASIEVFFEPEICDEPENPHAGAPMFGFDIRLKDGSGHFEYRVYQTGWGAKP
jgi:hypothetical protein